jgi:hypothetical protein
MLSKLFSKDYVNDRPLLVLASVLVVSTLGLILRVILSVEQYDFKVAVSYTQYGADSFVLGDWYSLYGFAVFAFISTIAAVAISGRLHRQDRGLSYVVLSLQLIVLVFLALITNALLNASSIVS